VSVLTRITESYTTEQFLINNPQHILCTYLTSLRNEFDVIVENYERTSERFSLEESLYDRAVCTAERNGLVGRPRIQVTEEQLTTLLFKFRYR
jgi:hypothetical protein